MGRPHSRRGGRRMASGAEPRQRTRTLELLCTAHWALRTLQRRTVGRAPPHVQSGLRAGQTGMALTWTCK
jgi:hypothetical protein